MSSLRMRLSLMAALLCAGALSACGGPQAAEPTEVVFQAADFSFNGPDTVPAGTTKVTVDNQGQSLHQVALMQLGEGKTFADFTTYAQTASESEPVPAWLTPAGGPVVAAPGQSASSFVDLQPGEYVLMCNIPDAQGTPHYALGQVRGLQVTAADGAAAAPAADLTVNEQDFAFGWPSEVAAGAHVIQAKNGGQQPHEAILVKLDEGATAQDVAAAFAPGGDGQPPALPMGGVGVIPPGASQSFPVDLTPGRYAWLCFFPDTASGKAHAELGMMAEFDVN